MGKKKQRGIDLPQGYTYVMFDDTNEDLSALPRQQRRLRERLKIKERDREIRKFMKAKKSPTSDQT